MKKYISAMLLSAVFCILMLGTIHAQLIQQGISERILRFHVLANSDSACDQELKTKIRDAVGTYMSEELKEAGSLSECKEIAGKQISQIEQVASGVIQREGYRYPVRASIENCRFPQKTYGPYTFPAGTYEALRVVIGSGKGHNWWCVMYPNLCFSGSMYGIEEDTGKRLEKELTAQEYAAVFDEGDVNVEFQLLRFLNHVLD